MIALRHKFLSALLATTLILPAAIIAADPQTLNVGAIFSVSGRAKALGQPEKETVVLVTDMINKAGGINGSRLHVVVEDDDTSESAAMAAADKLINQDKVLAIIGPSISGISLKVKPVCESAGVPMVSCAAAEAIVTPPETSRYIFKTPQLDSHVAVRILEHMKQNGITKIFVLRETSPFGEEGAGKIRHYAPGLGIEVVGEETFKPRDTTMTDQLKKAGERGAQAVVNWSIPPTQTIIPKDMRRIGMNVPLYSSHSFGNPKLLKAAGPAGEGMVFPGGRLLVAPDLPADHPHKSMLMAYKQAYEKEYNTPVTTFGGHAYDAIWLVANALKAMNVTPQMNPAQARRAVRDGIEQTRGWQGTGGRFNMTPTDHTGLDKNDSLEMLTVKNGAIVRLVP
ncbi:MAG: ABC transporter substrate-binding protein [Pseudomonadota bacterium]